MAADCADVRCALKLMTAIVQEQHLTAVVRSIISYLLFILRLGLANFDLRCGFFDTPLLPDHV